MSNDVDLSDDDAERAEMLANDIMRRYADIMHIDDETRNAVIIKAIALIALAYGFPPVAGKPLDIDDVLTKLTQAEKVLAKKCN